MHDQPLGPDGTPTPSDLPASDPAPISAAEIDALDSRLRALARTLVADEGLAEDAVQEAWIVILGRPRERIESIRAWVSQVLRHKVAAIVQRRSRSREIEQRFAEDEQARKQWSPAHREDGKQLLRDAIGGLAEPYRTVLQRRFFDVQEVSEIAAALGRSESTIRSQLSRGVRELRRVVDQRYGGRENWAALILPLADLSSRTVRAVGLIGSQWGLWAACIVLFLSTAFGGWWWIGRATDKGPEDLSIAQVDSPLEPKAEHVEDLATETINRSSALETAPVSPEARPDEVQPDAKAPAVATVRIELRDSSGALSLHPRVEFRNREQLVRFEEFDDNPFDLELSKDVRLVGGGAIVQFSVSAEGEARSPSIRLEPEKLTGKTLSLATRGPAATVEFHVVDEDGNGIEGAEVIMRPKGSQGIAVLDDGVRQVDVGTRAVADMSGTATILRAPQLTRGLRVSAPGFSSTVSELILSQESASVVVDLKAGAVLRGSVRGASGQPLVGARVSTVRRMSPEKRLDGVETVTNENGEYVLTGIDRGPAHVVAEWAATEDSPLMDSTVIDATDGKALVWDAHPMPHYGLTVRFEDEVGKPFANSLAVIFPTENSMPNFSSLTKTDESGIAHFPLALDFPVNAILQRGENDSPVVAKGLTRATSKDAVLDIVVPRPSGRGASLSGTLPMSEEVASGSTQVRVIKANEPVYVDVDAHTGSFLFDDMPAGSYDVEALLVGLGSVSLGTITLAPGERVEFGEVLVPELIEVHIDWGGKPPSRDNVWSLSVGTVETQDHRVPVTIMDEPDSMIRLLPGDYVFFSDKTRHEVPVTVELGAERVDVLVE